MKIQCKVCGLIVEESYKSLHERTSKHLAAVKAKELIKKSMVRLVDVVGDLASLPKVKRTYYHHSKPYIEDRQFSPFTHSLEGLQASHLAWEYTYTIDNDFTSPMGEYWISSSINAKTYVSALIEEHNRLEEALLKNHQADARQRHTKRYYDKAKTARVAKEIRDAFDMSPQDFKKMTHYTGAISDLKTYINMQLPLGLRCKSFYYSPYNRRIGFIVDGKHMRPWATHVRYDRADVTKDDVMLSIFPREVLLALTIGKPVVRQGDFYFIPNSTWRPTEGWAQFDPDATRTAIDRYFSDRHSHIVEGELWCDGRDNYLVRGKITHPEHPTITLKTWHNVYRGNARYYGKEYD